MGKLSRKSLERIVILLIGIVYGLVSEWFTLSEYISYSIIITLLLFVADELLDRDQPITEINKNKRETFINIDKRFHGKLLTDLQAELDRVIRVDTDKFAVDHPLLAIASYDSFWRILVDHQQISKTPLSVQAIHSCDIDIWVTHPLTQSLLSRQKQFCETGGTISRILCGREPTPNEDIQQAARGMLEAGITVYYYNLRDNKVVDYGFSWDFMRIVETEHAVVWDSFASRPNGVIDEAIYCRHSEYKGRNLAELWEDIRVHSTLMS
jgi:hypothetical protein